MFALRKMCLLANQFSLCLCVFVSLCMCVFVSFCLFVFLSFLCILRLVQGGAVSVCPAENVLACLQTNFPTKYGREKTPSIKHQTRAGYLQKYLHLNFDFGKRFEHRQTGGCS